VCVQIKTPNKNKKEIKNLNKILLGKKTNPPPVVGDGEDHNFTFWGEKEGGGGANT